MISAFLSTVKIPELRRRIFFTLAIIVIVRLGAAITTPGVNQAVLSEWFRSTADKAGGVAALFNLFSGGGHGGFAPFSLRILTSIDATVIVSTIVAGTTYTRWMRVAGGSGRERMLSKPDAARASCQ